MATNKLNTIDMTRHLWNVMYVRIKRIISS